MMQFAAYIIVNRLRRIYTGEQLLKLKDHNYNTRNGKFLSFNNSLKM